MRTTYVQRFRDQAAGRITLHAALLLVLSFTLTGCLVAENPVSTARHAEPTAVGEWICTSDRDNAAHPMQLAICEDKDGMYNVVRTEFTQEGKPRTESLTVCLSRGPKHTYANMLYLTPIDNGKSGDKTIGADTKFQTQYMIYQYEVAPGQLTARAMGYAELAAAIQSGKLHGKAWETTWGVNAVITDASPELLAFLETDEGQRLFTNTLTFKSRK